MVFLQLSPAFPHFSGAVGGGFKSIHEVQEVLGIFGKKVEPWQRWPFSDNRVFVALIWFWVKTLGPGWYTKS
jgi:hypothetical protein